MGSATADKARRRQRTRRGRRHASLVTARHDVRIQKTNQDSTSVVTQPTPPPTAAWRVPTTTQGTAGTTTAAGKTRKSLLGDRAMEVVHNVTAVTIGFASGRIASLSAKFSQMREFGLEGADCLLSDNFPWQSVIDMDIQIQRAEIHVHAAIHLIDT